MTTRTEEQPPPEGRLAVNTAIFAGATVLSRVAGLARETTQAAFFATSAAFSAFALASQVPNLFVNLFAQAALSAAFVPVFTELLQSGRKRDAFRVTSTLFWLILIVLGVLTAIWMAIAGPVVGLFTGPHIPIPLTAGLSRLLFPVVLLLSLQGLVVGVLQSYDRFTIPALAPAAWNLVILGGLIGLAHQFSPGHRVYAYAIGWLAATVIQFLIISVDLRNVEWRLSLHCDWRDPRVRQVLLLFLPVTLSVGIINLDSFANVAVGSLVSSHVPAAINDAFRIYLLPQGVFSVAVTTVLFPTLSRFAVRRDSGAMRRAVGTGMRQINLLLIPSALLMLVLRTPITRLLYQHGAFHANSTQLVSTALLWYSISLPFAGLNLLMTRTLFAVQKPWIATRLAAVNIVIVLVAALLLYRPLGIAGPVLATVIANVVMAARQAHRLRIGFNGRLEGAQTLMITARIAVASVLMAALAFGVWTGLDRLLGRSLAAQIVAVALSIVLAGALYVWLTLRMRIPEARQIQQLLRRRFAVAST